MIPDDMVACGQPEVRDVAVGTDFEILIPPKGRGLMYASMTCVDTSTGAPVAVDCELSWVDFDVTKATAATVAKKTVCIRDRGGVPAIEDYYWAGPAGRGELNKAASAPGKAMRLYAYIKGSALVSGQAARLTVQWGR